MLGFVCDSSYHTPITSFLLYTNQIPPTDTPIKTLLLYTNQIPPRSTPIKIHTNPIDQPKSFPLLPPIITHAFPANPTFPHSFPRSPYYPSLSLISFM